MNKRLKSKAATKILVVDDEPDICYFAKSFFESRGFDVFIAFSGEEALTMIKQDMPDIVLLDIMMVGMDGITTLRKIKEINPSIKVMMVTAVEEEKKVRDAMSLGATDYVTNPLVLEDLENKVVSIASELKK